MANEIQPTSTEQLDLIEDLFKIPDESQTAKPPAEGDLEGEPEVTEPQETEEEEEVAVDYTLEVPIVNGEKLTVGELKDYYQAQQKAQTDFIDRENKMMKQYEEVRQLTEQLGVVPPQAIEHARHQLQETVKQEFQAMLDVIPQWKDAVEFSKGRDAIYDLAKSYGIERDIGKVVDHRVIKMLFDYSRLRGDIKSAKEQVKPLPSKNDPKGNPAKYQSKQDELNKTIAIAKSGSQSQKLAAIDSLLRN